MSDSGLNYTFTCPSCSGNFSILLERIPPVQARFRCPHCKQPMDFPSREEARVYATLQAQNGPVGADPPSAPAFAAAAATPIAAASAPPPQAPKAPVWTPPAPGSMPPEASDAAANQRFRVEKPGFESDVFDRRAIRNLIRTGEVGEADPVSVDEAATVPAGQVPFLKSLFKLRATSTVTPPARCRTHTDQLAFYACQDTARPLCEECAPEKKFGNSTVRVCGHCGGTAKDLAPPAEA
ncbi:MAG TPA: MJ0042-type zinc finger domain-containing protein [Thermoanaerobaculia bacterium]|nr:MJ0042-type zinc finger domain-containing protein [Thermoanaerobaculia bacterium]